MAQPVILPHKPMDLSLDPQCPCKQATMAAHICMSSSRKAGTGGHVWWGAWWAAVQLNEGTPHWEKTSQKIKWGASEENIRYWPLLFSPPHMHTSTHTQAHACTHMNEDTCISYRHTKTSTYFQKLDSDSCAVDSSARAVAMAAVYTMCCWSTEKLCGETAKCILSLSPLLFSFL